jgi:hypothetical protein
MHRRRSVAVLGLFLTVAAVPAASQTIQERVDLSVVARIRDEALNRSLIPDLAGYLTDVIGPRLTGSTGMRQANDWTAQQFRSWGLANVTVEPWGKFGRGWERADAGALRAAAQRAAARLERQHARHGHGPRHDDRDRRHG